MGSMIKGGLDVLSGKSHPKAKFLFPFFGFELDLDFGLGLGC